MTKPTQGISGNRVVFALTQEIIYYDQEIQGCNVINPWEGVGANFSNMCSVCSTEDAQL